MMASPVGPYLPTGALVAVGWIGTRVPGFAPAMVATKLPREISDWAEVGFAKVTMIPGAAEIDIAIRHSMAQLDFYGVTMAADGSASAKPAVMKATRLAELVLRGMEDEVQRLGGFGKPVTLPANYAPARVLAAYPLTDPVEVEGDPSGYGRVTVDVMFDWARI